MLNQNLNLLEEYTVYHVNCVMLNLIGKLLVTVVTVQVLILGLVVDSRSYSGLLNHSSAYPKKDVPEVFGLTRNQCYCNYQHVVF